ncbi:DUF1330 domain-containing protein [Shimia sp. W99]
MSYVFMVARPGQKGHAAFDRFVEKSRPVVAAFDGHFQESDGTESTGQASGSGAMVVRFTSMSRARAFYESEDYARLHGASEQ